MSQAPTVSTGHTPPRPMPAAAATTAADDGGPAFPLAHDLPPTEGHTRAINVEPGMSLRDYFAAKAMHAEIATAGAFDGPAGALVEAANACGMGIEERIAYNAYAMADAMLKERVK